MSKLIRLIRESLNGEEQSYTTGSINRALALLSIPMILEMAMESLFAVVDAFFVARISADAIATVGITEAIITLVYSMAIGISTAPMAMIARHIGEGDREAASKVIMQAVYLSVGVSLLIGVPGFLFAEDILRLMGAGDAVVASGAGYARIMFGSNIVIMLLFLLNGIFRGAGDAAFAMQSLWIANIINIILDPIFIFGLGPIPAMGVEGAAIATVIGRSAGVAFQLYLLISGRAKVRIYWNQLRPDRVIMGKLANIAATGAGQFLIASASWIFLMRIIARFGSEAVAGYTIAIRLIIFTLLPSWGLANAAGTLVGQNLGAKQPERAATSVWRAANWSVIFLLAVAITYFVGAPYIIPLFTQEVAVVSAGVLALRIFSAGYVFFGYGTVIVQAFNGAGDTRTPTYLNLLCFWMLEIPLGYVLAVNMGYGLGGVCTAVVMAESTLALLSVWLFRRGKWKTQEI